MPQSIPEKNYRFQILLLVNLSGIIESFHAGIKKFVPTQKRTDGRLRPQWLTYVVVKSSKRKRNAWRKYKQVPTRETYEKYKNISNLTTKVIRYQKGQLEKKNMYE